jgi:hypothetical protein
MSEELDREAWRFLLRRRRDAEEAERLAIEIEARKRSAVEILRAIRERGWWWPDGS